jgi:5'-3' exonuclease
MILVDFHQTMIANIIKMIYSDSTFEINEELLRNNILSSLLRYRRLFKKEYGELLISCDSKSSSWRKDKFPYYKARRKKDKEKSEVDWDFIYNFMIKIKEEIKVNLPFTLIEINKTESDDIIAILNEYISSESLDTKNIIVSMDKDFFQLLNERTDIYSPVTNKIINKMLFDADPLTKDLITHILNGDLTDGIPNVLSADDTFIIEGKRQIPLTQKRIKTLMENAEELNKSFFKRNQELIDFMFIPQYIKESIIDYYKKEKEIKKSFKSFKLMNYLIENRLNNMMENIQQFYI